MKDKIYCARCKKEIKKIELKKESIKGAIDGIQFGLIWEATSEGVDYWFEIVEKLEEYLKLCDKDKDLINGDKD